MHNINNLFIVFAALHKSGMQPMTVVFPKSEKRTHFEKLFNEVKLKITTALDHQPKPEFISNAIFFQFQNYLCL